MESLGRKMMGWFGAVLFGLIAIKGALYVENRINSKIQADQKAAHYQGDMVKQLTRIADEMERERKSQVRHLGGDNE